MKIMIVNDGGATKLAKEVPDMAAVDALRANGFAVEIVEDALPVETVVYDDGIEATGVAPLPKGSTAKGKKSKG